MADKFINGNTTLENNGTSTILKNGSTTLFAINNTTAKFGDSTFGVIEADAVTINGTSGSITVAVVTETQRDDMVTGGAAVQGTVVYNTTASRFQGYNGATWDNFT